MHSSQPNEGRETYQFAGGLMTVLADGAFTDGRYSLLLAHIPPGNATPPHFHDEDSETLVMLDGAMTAETPGRSIILHPDEVAILPPGQVHRLSNAAEEDAHYLLLCAPAGFEDFVRRAGTRIDDSIALPREMGEDDIRLMVENAAAYGVRLTDGAELADSASAELPAAPRETFVAFGTSIEVLARIDDGRDGIVLIRATAIAPNGVQRAPLTAPGSTDTRFFAGTGALNGSRHGTFASASEPALLAVTTDNVLRLLREDVMSELIIADGGPLGRLLLVLSALHATRPGDRTDAASPVGEALAARRGLPIH